MVCNSATSMALLENGATLEGGSIFFLIMIVKEKTAPPSKVALFSKTAPGWSRFGSTFFSVMSLQHMTHYSSDHGEFLLHIFDLIYPFQSGHV